jgi:NAD(P)-dependent dehydrogenase (short-subunit alcohol dehydrogenase family)
VARELRTPARMGRVSEKVAIVTGAAAGIGRAAALLLAREGAAVIVVDVDETGGAETSQVIANNGAKSAFFPYDVRSEEAWRLLVREVTAGFGRIDVLVNNAGIYLIRDLARTTVEDLDEILTTNVRSVFLGMKHCAPVMAHQKRGSIVNVSSMDGNVGSAGHTAYGGSKGAVRTMTKDVAIEYAGHGVRVNSIHPGYIRTKMAEYGARVYGETLEELGAEFPMGHIGEPIDVAYGVLYLASDESRFVTGAELAIDGGALAG